MSARRPVPWCPISADERHHWKSCDTARCLACGWSRTDVGRARLLTRRFGHRVHRHPRQRRHDHHMLTRGQWWQHMWTSHGMPKVTA